MGVGLFFTSTASAEFFFGGGGNVPPTIFFLVGGDYSSVSFLLFSPSDFLSLGHFALVSKLYPTANITKYQTHLTVIA